MKPAANRIPAVHTPTPEFVFHNDKEKSVCVCKCGAVYNRINRLQCYQDGKGDVRCCNCNCLLNAKNVAQGTKTKAAPSVKAQAKAAA